MTTWTRTIIWCLIITICFGGSSASSQDFDALLQAVNRIETNLKKLVQQEATTRNKETSELRSAIAKLQKKSNHGSAGAATEQQLLEVISEMAALQIEVEALKGMLGKNNQQLASLDMENWVVPDQSNDEVKQLADKLAVINDNVEALAASQSRLPSSKPSGQKTTVNGRLYSHGRVNSSKGSDNYNEFALSRAYVTLKSKLSSYASIRLTSDLKPIDDKYNIILKYAYLDWKPGFTQGYSKLRFGLQATQYIDQMNKLWGRRYLEKTVSDQRKFLTSSDLGISTIVGFGPKSKYGFVSLALLNGTSYSHVQELNSNKDFNLVSMVKPFKNIPTFSKSAIMMQIYSGTQNKSTDDIVSVDTSAAPWDTTTTEVRGSDWKRQILSVGGLLAWNSTLDFGFDMNFTKVGEGAGEVAVKKRGLSFFSTFYLHKLAARSSFMSSINFFGRFDIYDPNTRSGNDRENLGIFGVESVPVKGFKVSLNYRLTNYQDSTLNSKSMIYLNTLLKF